MILLGKPNPKKLNEVQQVYCQDCNTGNTVDSKYCKECGSKINSGYRTLMLSIQDVPVGQSDEDVEQLTRLLGHGLLAQSSRQCRRRPSPPARPR